MTHQVGAAPIEAVFDSWAASGNASRLLRLPFRNAFSLLDGFDDERRAAERLEELYAEQLAAIGVVDNEAPRAANDEPLRPAPYNLLVTSIWESPAESDANTRWTRDFFDAMQPFLADGVYVNYLGQEGEERVRAAYGAKYNRLVALKNKYDPTNFFRMNQNIRPSVRTS